MASKPSNDSIDCPICFDMLENPKQLPCLHTFCQKCLVKLCEDKDAGEQIPCPLCRNEFAIPVGGVKNTPDNELLMRLVLRKKLKKGTKEKEWCELCLGAQQFLEAAAFCLDCRQHLCSDCRLRHSNLKLRKLHTIVDAKDKPSDGELDKSQAAYCSVHINRELELYCCDDKTIICLMCHATNHAMHKCKALGEIAENSRKNIETILTNVNQFIPLQRKYIDNINVFKEKFLASITSAESALQDKCRKLHDMLDEREKELNTELNKIKEERLKELADHKESREVWYTASDSFLAYGRTILEQGTDNEVVKCTDELNKRAEALYKSHSEARRQILKPKIVKFVEASSAASVYSMKDFLGRIEYREAAEDLYSSTEVNLDVIQHEKRVRGITVVGDEVFVVRSDQSQVNVYESHNLRASRDINIPDMTSPWGVAGCACNKALYISDDELKCIRRVDLSNNSVTRWEMRENQFPRGLSVTAEHTLLVTVWISYIGWESRVVEYTSEGQQLREIRFDKNIEWAWHTVQLSSNQFIVCHGGHGSSQDRVCVMNAEGQIMKSFGREMGRGKGQLNEPRSVILYENCKHAFVADFGNHKVLMLDPELNCLGRVHAPRDLGYPSCLYFDSSTGRLFVGEWFSGRLLVISP